MPNRDAAYNFADCNAAATGSSCGPVAASP